MSNNFADLPFIIKLVGSAKQSIYLPGFVPPSFIHLLPNQQLECLTFDADHYILDHYILTNLNNEPMDINNPLAIFKICKLLDAYFTNDLNPAISPEHLGGVKIYQQLKGLINLVAEQNNLSFNEPIIESYIMAHKAEINLTACALPNDDISYVDIYDNINEREVFRDSTFNWDYQFNLPSPALMLV